MKPVYVVPLCVLGSFTCITQPTVHTGPMALQPIWRTKQYWFSVVLKDIHPWTGLKPALCWPEFEFSALGHDMKSWDSKCMLRWGACLCNCTNPWLKCFFMWWLLSHSHNFRCGPISLFILQFCLNPYTVWNKALYTRYFHKFWVKKVHWQITRVGLCWYCHACIY